MVSLVNLPKSNSLYPLKEFDDYAKALESNRQSWYSALDDLLKDDAKTNKDIIDYIYQREDGKHIIGQIFHEACKLKQEHPNDEDISKFHPNLENVKASLETFSKQFLVNLAQITIDSMAIKLHRDRFEKAGQEEKRNLAARISIAPNQDNNQS